MHDGSCDDIDLLIEMLVVLSAWIGFDAKQIVRRQNDMTNDDMANAEAEKKANASGGTDGFQYGAPIATVLFVVAIMIVFVTAASWAFTKTLPGYSGGGAAATVLFLVVVALVLARPSLIMDDVPSEGGEPSTMRILSLAIVLTFCAIMLRNGWNDGALPSLEQQGNWVWLVTAALGGKALQKYAEVQQKKEEIRAKAEKERSA